MTDSMREDNYEHIESNRPKFKLEFIYSDDSWEATVQRLVHLHDKKKADYADEDQFSNFKESAEYAGVTVEQAINVLIGTKIARLRNLRKPGKIPKNESIADTEIDLANYIIILHAWKLENSKILDNASSPAS